MIPTLRTPWGALPSFALCAVLGVLSMLLAVHFSLRAEVDGDGRREEDYIFPKLVACGFSGVVCAALSDSLFKYMKNGVFRLSGISFYGGLLGAALTLWLLLRAFPRGTRYSRAEWFDRLTVPFLLFHAWGRVGCFLGGCCYGRQTDSFLGVVFPDQPDAGLLHGGVARYPTQLMEAVSLLLIVLTVLFVKHRFRVYLGSYAAIRFFLELLRGDDRGALVFGLSPAQWISVGILSVLLVTGLLRIRKGKRGERREGEIC